MIFFSFFLFFIAASIAQTTVKTITRLPGWTGPLPSTWHSGFVDTGPAPNGSPMRSHFVFVEAENDPLDAPVVMWLQGGPGASSLYGLLVELGPLRLNDASLHTDEYNKTGVPSLQYNPYAWTQFANILVVDFPCPIGFSYCNGNPGGSGTSCGAWNDTSAMLVTKNTVYGFFSLFPQFSTNDFHLTGESYAGVSVPLLAEALLDDAQLNLISMAVGDGCQGSDILCGHGGGIWYDLLFFYGHAQTPTWLFQKITKACTEIELKSGRYSPTCKPAVDEFNARVGQNEPYFLYNDCQDNIFKKRKRNGPVDRYGFVCSGNGMGEWLKNPAVRAALGVPLNSNFFNVDNGNGFVYHTTERNVLPIYQRFQQTPALRAMTYSADADPAINSFVLQDIFFELFQGQPIEELWRPYSDSKTSPFTYGYVQKYAGNFTFGTIRGAAHQAPMSNNKQAALLIGSFILNQELPRN